MTICNRNERGGEMERDRCFREDVGGERENERERRHRRHCEQKFVALNSSTGGAGPLPIITTPLTHPINVTSVTVDTRCAREFDEDASVRILLIFTCILNLPVGVLVTLNFQLTRSNGESTIPVGPTFTFADLISVLESEAFSFQFFDSDLDPGNYTYSVEVAPTSIISVVPGVTITNATLSAIASADE